ncbi:hypothetical protein HPB48_000872 [Haemaphysalis longicornis]|uniref:Bicarbonate transporter-like transmembrane domain-containing protein n=1 Tax=Haemaphysalis longicornis TaxID=44386 RepID=A0A9J6FWG8_HAELO|nr:hypothetical protein HPB48_000872 [Haemaphysalis longicornis]
MPLTDVWLFFFSLRAAAIDDAVRSATQARRCPIAQGLNDDLRRRLSHYVSDYIDGVVGHRTIYKTISTIFFLYFACLLPTIAFGALNDTNTKGKIGEFILLRHRANLSPWTHVVV